MWMVVLIVGFAGAVALHTVVNSIVRAGTVVSRFLATGGAVGIGVLVYGYLEWGPTAQFFALGFAYALLCEFYLFCITFVLSSISANLAIQMLQRSLDRDDLDRLYDSRYMVETRIDRLTEIGLLTVSEGQLHAGQRGQRLARVFEPIQRYFNHR